jgi:uncharacterized protein (DUF885 family)
MVRLYDKYFEEIVKLNPTFATFMGIHKYNDKFENVYSKEYISMYKKIILKYIKLNNKELIKDSTNHYARLLNYELTMSLDGYKYNGELLPIDQNNIIPIMIQMVNDKFFPQDTIQDYRNIINRYKVVATICDTMIERMKEGIKKGYVQPKRIIKLVIKQYEIILKDKEYYITVPKEIQDEFNKTIDNYFVVSIKKLLLFLKDVYIKRCRNTIGYYDLPNGNKFYEHIAKSFTTTNMNIDEIHDLGLFEVNRIHNEMILIKNKVNFKESLKQFNNYLKTNKKFQYRNRNEIMNGYKIEQTLIEKTIMPKYFHKAKKGFLSHNYLIKPVPKYQEKNSPGAYYYMPSSDLKRKGCFYLNMYDISSVTKYTTKVLSLHEGNPGHHYQLTYTIDQKLPLYVIYADYTAYIEGWALYTETLGDYTDPYNYYGKLSYEMLRALRLVIDTGIHYYKWSFNKVLKYFKKHYNGSDTEIINEIHRYIANPGQALAYKIGELTIKKLRCNWSGDIKDFHQKILENGPMPMNLLIEKFNTINYTNIQ